MALSANQRGIFALIGGMAAYTINDAMMKSIAYKYPVGEIIFIRALVTAALIGAAVSGIAGAQNRLGHVYAESSTLSDARFKEKMAVTRARNGVNPSVSG